MELTNIKIVFVLSNKERIIYKLYYLLNQFYVEYISNLKTQTFIISNKKNIKKIISTSYKSFYYNDEIIQYEFSFSDQFVLYENEVLNSRYFVKTLEDFIQFLTNSTINEAMVKSIIIKNTKNNITNIFPNEIVDMILRIFYLNSI